MAASGNSPLGTVGSVRDLGLLVSRRRREQGLTQADLAGLGMIGNRFIGEFERGKEAVQLGRVMHVLNLLGLDLVVVERGTQGR